MKIHIGRKIEFCAIGANLVGGLLLYIYFYHINHYLIHSGSSYAWYQHLAVVIYVAANIALDEWIIGRLFDDDFFDVANGSKSIDALDSVTATKLKKRAVQWVPVLATITAIGWFLFGLIFGFMEPAFSHAFLGTQARNLIDCIKVFFAIAVIGGTVSTLIIYFWIESIWRKAMPLFFPDGALGQAKFEFNIRIRTRLMVAFLTLSLFPLPLLITTAYSNTQAMLNADVYTRMQIVSTLSIEILYVSFICIVIAIFLTFFVSISVSYPLKSIENAFKKIDNENLSVRVDIVSNDEFGVVADGFNDMAYRLETAEQIKDSFGKYVSKEIRDEILSGKVTLEGEMKRVTLLFSDLRNFTTLVEKHHPTEVIKVINQYFTEMTSAIKTYRGQVLQYVGDEIEAVFGAPVVYDDHPDMAVAAAIEMQRRLDLLNNNLEAQGFDPLKHGIGIHTGAVLAGNIGSKDRISYALIGDTVNLASRIEGLTKEYGSDILISQTTHDLLAGKFETQQLSAVQIKGKKEQVMIYKIVNLSDLE